MSTELKYDVEGGNKYKSVQARLKSLKENNIGDKVIMDMYWEWGSLLSTVGAVEKWRQFTVLASWLVASQFPLL